MEGRFRGTLNMARAAADFFTARQTLNLRRRNSLNSSVLGEMAQKDSLHHRDRMRS
jgi:hypothetical protein